MTTASQMAASVMGKLQKATAECPMRQGEIAAQIGMRRERFNRIMNNREQPTLDEACVWASIVNVEVCAKYSTETQVTERPS